MGVLLSVLLFSLLLMLAVWALAFLINNPSIVDVFWSLGLMTAGYIYLLPFCKHSSIVVILLLLAIWAFRLAGYLYFTRIKQKIVDKRYLYLNQAWTKQWIGYLLNFQLQAVLIFFISSVFFIIRYRNSFELHYLDYVAIFICIIGIIGETLADYQLTQFKKANPTKLCDAGLWYYPRHPNYFFDWITWCGFSVFALQAPYGYFAFISPLLLYVLMRKVTGPITEQLSIKKRGESYLAYQRTTSMFVPWKKR